LSPYTFGSLADLNKQHQVIISFHHLYNWRKRWDLVSLRNVTNEEQARVCNRIHIHQETMRPLCTC